MCRLSLRPSLRVHWHTAPCGRPCVEYSAELQRPGWQASVRHARQCELQCDPRASTTHDLHGDHAVLAFLTSASLGAHNDHSASRLDACRPAAALYRTRYRAHSCRRAPWSRVDRPAHRHTRRCGGAADRRSTRHTTLPTHYHAHDFRSSPGESSHLLDIGERGATSAGDARTASRSHPRPQLKQLQYRGPATTTPRRTARSWCVHTDTETRDTQTQQGRRAPIFRGSTRNGGAPSLSFPTRPPCDHSPSSHASHPPTTLRPPNAARAAAPALHAVRPATASTNHNASTVFSLPPPTWHHCIHQLHAAKCAHACGSAAHMLGWHSGRQRLRCGPMPASAISPQN